MADVRFTGRVLLLDFDGTVCLGDGPALRYAQEAARHLDRDAARDLLDRLGEFLAGRPGVSRAQDGYQLVQEVASGHGLAAPDLSAAYLAGRRALVAGEIEVSAPPGLAGLLASLHEVHVAVVTNAPGSGMAELLDRLGLADVVAEVVGDARKPVGMEPLLDAVLTRFDIAHEPRRLLSVGDVWANDLAVPAARGCTTAYVDRFGRAQGPADVVAPEITALYPAVRDWALDAATFRARTRL